MKKNETFIGIAGCGGIGGNTAVLLLRSGFRRFVLADFDAVDESNLNRQFFFKDQIGRPKTEALAENLRRIEPQSAAAWFSSATEQAIRIKIRRRDRKW